MNDLFHLTCSGIDMGWNFKARRYKNHQFIKRRERESEYGQMWTSFMKTNVNLQLCGMLTEHEDFSTLNTWTYIWIPLIGPWGIVPYRRWMASFKNSTSTSVQRQNWRGSFCETDKPTFIPPSSSAGPAVWRWKWIHGLFSFAQMSATAWRSSMRDYLRMCPSLWRTQLLGKTALISVVVQHVVVTLLF